MPLIRSISGLRATLGDGLKPDVLSRYAAGFAKFLPKGKIFIGRDGRPSGEWIEQIIVGALTACGREVNLLGVVPTPTVQLMVEHSAAVGGIVITASHNPLQWNGLKFLNNAGVFLDSDENKKMWGYIDRKDFDYSTVDDKIPDLILSESPLEQHIHKVLDLPLFEGPDIFKKIRKRKYKIVVDAVNASGSQAIPHLLEHMGCDVIKLHCDSTGIFPHTPEPVPGNLGSLAEEVKKQKADIGMAVDPDADRLVLIDETGTPIGEEKTVSIAIDAVLNARKKAGEKDLSCAVNYSTTRLVDDIAEMHGAKVFRSAVGEINVVKKMKECKAVIGGEGSGGVIFPECHYGRDSLVGAALAIYHLTETGKTLSQISREYPQYEVIKLKKEFTGDISGIIEKIAGEFSDGEVIRDDGIKVVFPKSWVQLRSSNTEPIVRIIAEAPDSEEASELTMRVMMLI